MHPNVPIAGQTLSFFEVRSACCPACTAMAPEPSVFGPIAEGGYTALDGLCSAKSHGRRPMAIIGGTGYVGRLVARRRLPRPPLCLGPVVGSKRSEGQLYQQVWEQKERALMQNYGNQLWKV